MVRLICLSLFSLRYSVIKNRLSTDLTNMNYTPPRPHDGGGGNYVER